MCENLGDISPRRADELVPFQKPLRTLTRIDLLVLLECRMSSFNGSRDVFCGVCWAASPGDVASRIFKKLVVTQKWMS